MAKKIILILMIAAWLLILPLAVIAQDQGGEQITEFLKVFGFSLAEIAQMAGVSAVGMLIINRLKDTFNLSGKGKVELASGIICLVLSAGMFYPDAIKIIFGGIAMWLLNVWPTVKIISEKAGGNA